jgi:hypothetical protein
MLLTITQQIDLPAALQVLMGLSLAVFGFWFIPAAIGAVAAIAKATESDVPSDNPGGESKESLARYQNPMGAGKMGMAGMHSDWQKMGQVGDVSRQGVWNQREMARQSRLQQQQALGQLQQYATGEKSAARLAAADAISQQQQAMASQAAGGGAAAQRAAMYGTAAAGQQVAGRVGTAAAQEQLGAQQAYLGGMGQMRAGDLGQFGAEAGYLRGQQAFGLGRQQAGLNAAALGMQQTQQERAAQMAYDQAVRGTMAGTQQAATAERGQNIGMIQSGMSALAQGVSGAAASDINVKQGVQPATPGEVYGNYEQQPSWWDTAQGMSADQELANRRTAYAGPSNAPGEWVNPYEPGVERVTDATYPNWDAQAQMNMKREDLARRQAYANMPLEQRYREGVRGPSDVQVKAATAAMQRKKQQVAGEKAKKEQPKGSNATLNALKGLFGKGSDNVKGDWGNTTLNSLQQLFASDEEVKKEKKVAAEVIDNLKAYTYDYKDPGAKGQAPGRQIGVMAQDMEKSPVGDKAVTETGKDGTKMIDYSKLGPLSFAAHAQANDRIKRLEAIVGKAIAPLAQAADTSALRRGFGEGDMTDADRQVYGGMTPEGGPGVIQEALGQFGAAADTSGLRGQFDEPGMGELAASDRTVKQSIKKADSEDLVGEIKRRVKNIDFSDQPLDVMARQPGRAQESTWLPPRLPPPPPPPRVPAESIPVTQPNVAVMRDGVPVPGSNLGTAGWLAGRQPQPTQTIVAANPEAAAFYAQQQREAERDKVAAFLNSIQRGQPLPGMRGAYAPRDVVGDYGRVSDAPLAARTVGR